MTWGWMAFAVTYVWAMAIAYLASGKQLRQLPAHKRQRARRAFSAMIWPLAMIGALDLD
jgi:hypothetical protein